MLLEIVMFKIRPAYVVHTRDVQKTADQLIKSA